MNVQQEIRTLANLLAALPSRAIDLASPRDCASCGEPAGTIYRWLCDECAKKLPATGEKNCCTSCGKVFDGIVTTACICAQCAELHPRWTRGKTLLRFEGPAVEIVHRLKYKGEKCLLHDVRKILRHREDIRSLLHGATIVPVPLHPSRLRERGYNQSLWLAEAFAREAGADVAELLVRMRDTGTQTLLTLEERRRNVKGAFRLARGARVHQSARYVLVDDVITTGSTLDACAETLADSGAQDLAVLTLARA